MYHTDAESLRWHPDVSTQPMVRALPKLAATLLSSFIFHHSATQPFAPSRLLLPFSPLPQCPAQSFFPGHSGSLLPRSAPARMTPLHLSFYTLNSFLVFTVWPKLHTLYTQGICSLSIPATNVFSFQDHWSLSWLTLTPPSVVPFFVPFLSY